MTYENQIRTLLEDPNRLIQTKPYTRQVMPAKIQVSALGNTININTRLDAPLPSLRYEPVPESQLLAELDPYSHKVLFDENIPSITVKTSDGGYLDIEYKRMSVPFQRNILDKQVLHLCSNPMSHILLNTDPDESISSAFIAFKQGWAERNIEGLKTDFVRKARSTGSAGLLFYYDYKGRCKARTLSYEDGYQICSHTDDNGDHILEAVYYEKDGVRYIDAYDDTYMYRFSDDGDADSGGWRRHQPAAHGFPEIPLVTKRTKVAWDRVQHLIEVYEVIINIFAVCQKKYGWGILYVKGQFNPQAKKIAGAQVLNDTSGDPAATAQFLDPPSSRNMIEYLEHTINLIQLGSGTTFLLPKDIKISGDTSGIAIQLTQELDMETARNGISEWQNAASKMSRLFKHGYANELVASGRYPTAITDFSRMNIATSFTVWRPQSDTEYNQSLVTLHAAGGISTLTLVEKNTISTPDEISRLSRQKADEAAVTDEEPTRHIDEAEPDR